MTRVRLPRYAKMRISVPIQRISASSRKRINALMKKTSASDRRSESTVGLSRDCTNFIFIRRGLVVVMPECHFYSLPSGLTNFPVNQHGALGEWIDEGKYTA